MSKLTSAVLSWGCLFLLAACGHDADHEARSVPEAPRDHHGARPALELNDGQKWPVDEHTRTSAAKMLSLVKTAAPVASVDDARDYAAALDAELKNLIQGCTMTGPAHDQLHVFLAALFPKLGVLKKEENLPQLQATQQEIVSLFDSYVQHFE